MLGDHTNPRLALWSVLIALAVVVPALIASTPGLMVEYTGFLLCFVLWYLIGRVA